MKSVGDNLVPDPSKSQVTANMTGTKTFQKVVSTGIDVAGFRGLKVFATGGDVTYYYNTDTTKTYRILTNTEGIIWLAQANVTQVVVTFTGASPVQGF